MKINKNDYKNIVEKIEADAIAMKAAQAANNQDTNRLTQRAAKYLSEVVDLASHSLSTPGFQAVTACEGEAGIITDLNQLIASVYRAPYARFSSGGSSLAILCLLAAVLPKICGTRKILLVDSNAHQSVTGGLIFGGWHVVRIPRPYYEKHGIYGPIEASEISKLIKTLGADNIAAVFYNAPGYNGFRNRSDERDIYRICKGKGIVVVTDSAWGSTYGLRDGDTHSLIDNADIVITSPHKRGLTPNSIACVLFRKSSHADFFSTAGRLGFSSTSPSYILLAIAQYRLAQVRAGRMEKSFELINKLSDELESRVPEIHPNLCVVRCTDMNADFHDRAHLLLSTTEIRDVDARQWASVLSTQFNFDVEKADQKTLLLLLSPQHHQQTDEIINTLQGALNLSFQLNSGDNK
jgi:arginine/lysine/ornithine decarboxylase